MPLFGKKKSQPTAVGSYPKQQSTTSQPYPQQPPVPAPYPTATSLPGSYSGMSQNPYQQGQSNIYPSVPPPGYTQSAPVIPPQSNVVQPVAAVSGQFDAGARFDSNKPVNIPPPPPGVAPTAAQVAAGQGRPVVMTQGKSDPLMGSDGGYTWY